MFCSFSALRFFTSFPRNDWCVGPPSHLEHQAHVPAQCVGQETTPWLFEAIVDIEW